MKIVELAIVVTATLVPMFVLAGEIDGDEWTKGSIGAIAAATVVAIREAYKAWRERHPKR